MSTSYETVKNDIQSHRFLLFKSNHCVTFYDDDPALPWATELIILLGGGTKQRQQRDIEMARDRWQDYKPASARSEKEMVLTRDFKELVKARLDRDPAARRALLQESVELMLSGDVDTGKAILRDYINATVGFDELAEATGTPPKSLMRMFSPKGNPQTRNLFAVLNHLQEQAGLRFKLSPAKVS